MDFWGDFCSFRDFLFDVPGLLEPPASHPAVRQVVGVDHPNGESGGREESCGSE